MGVQHRRALYVLGGLCAILWPILSELVFYAATSALARGALGPAAPGMAGCATRLAQLAQVPGFLALEWGRAAVQFLLWPFLLAAFRFASQQGERDCAGLALGLGLLSIATTAISQAMNPSVTHALGQAYLDAAHEGEGAAILATLSALLQWHAGLNRMASLLYQACVALLGLALIRSHTWKARGWIGLVGAVLALPAKLPLGWSVPTNLIWTGLGYFVWPVSMGIGLLRQRQGGQRMC